MQGFKHTKELLRKNQVAVPEVTVIKRDGKNINKYVK